MAKTNRPSGIILLTVMFFVLVVALLARAILITGPGVAKLANRADDKVRADTAAEAGASYARLQLRMDPEWKGALNATTVSTPDLVVVEDNGYVVGWLTAGENNEKSMFRIRFNFRDGPGGGDGLADSSSYPMDTVLLSVNNLTSLSDSLVPDVNPATYKVDDPAVGSILVPKGTAMIRVEGWAGGALSRTTGPVAAAPVGHLASSSVRVVYTRSIDPTIPDAALSAGDGIHAELTNPAVVSVIGSGTAKLRSKQGVTVSDYGGADNLLDMTGKVGRSDAAGLHAVHGDGIIENTEEVGDGKDFANLKWADVPVASSDPTADIQLPGGVYCIDDNNVWQYYDMDLATFKALTPDPTTSVRPGGTPLSDGFPEVRGTNATVGGLATDQNNPRGVLATKNVNVNTSTGGVKDFVMCNRSGRPMEKGETAATSPYLFDGVANPRNTAMGSLSLDNAILSSQGDVALLVNVVGMNGSITSEGKTAISATAVSLGQSGIDVVKQRLSVYSQKDLEVSTYVSTSGFSFPGIHFPPFVDIPGFTFPAYDGYVSLNLEGLIYSWEDVTIHSGTPGEPLHINSVTIGNQTFPAFPDQGYIHVKGAIVAYGGNPNSPSGPGSAGNGKLNLYGLGTKIEYDRSKLSNPAAPPDSGIPLERRAYLYEN